LLRQRGLLHRKSLFVASVLLRCLSAARALDRK